MLAFLRSHSVCGAAVFAWLASRSLIGHALGMNLFTFVEHNTHEHMLSFNIFATKLFVVFVLCFCSACVCVFVCAQLVVLHCGLFASIERCESFSRRVACHDATCDLINAHRKIVGCCLLFFFPVEKHYRK